MKTKILLLTFTLLTFTGLSAQKTYTTNYEVQYKVNYSPDSTHLESREDQMLYLYSGGQYGVFMNEDKAEEIAADKEKQLQMSREITIKPGASFFDKTFYKNLQTGKVLTETEIGSKDFLFEEPKMPLSWQMSDSTKTVKGYSVQKATTHFAGRDYVVWFTLSVPIHDGPYLFAGLPGLIVELYDTRNDYHFTLQSLQKLEEPKTWSIPEAEKVTKAEFKNLKAKAAKNAPRDFREAANQALEELNRDEADVEIKVTRDGRKISKGEERRMFEKIRQAKNNPIELK